MQHIESDSDDSEELGNNIPKIINGYKIIKKIANKRKADVFLVQKDDVKYCLKLFIEIDQLQDKEKKRIVHEIQAMENLKNVPNTVQLIEHFNFKNRQVIVLEYCGEGNLYSVLKSKEKGIFKEEEALEILRELVYGVQAMHQNNVIHRNIKLENIMFKDSQLKIGGFGISQVLQLGTSSFQMEGTLEYLSPEMAYIMPYNHQVDVWSIGVVLYLILFHQFPFGRHSSQNKQAITINSQCEKRYDLLESFKINKIKNPQKISKDLQDLFARIFTIKQDNRIQCSQIWDHPAIEVEYIVEFSQKKEIPEKLKRYGSNENNIPKKKQASYTSSAVLKLVKSKQEETFHNEQSILNSQQPHKEDELPNLELSKIRASSKFLHGESQQFSQHYRTYNLQISRYHLLIEQYNQLTEPTILHKFQNSLDFLYQFDLFNYFILKVMVFYIKWLNMILEKEVNEFKLEDFEEFVQQEQYQQYLTIVKNDLEQYEKLFQKYYSILSKDIPNLPQSVKQEIEPKINISYRNGYGNLPESLKLSYRAVMLGVFGNLYDQATRYMQLKMKISNTIVNNNERKRFSRKEGQIRLRFSLRILVCAIINRIFNFSKFKMHNNIQDFQMGDFIEWVHTTEDIDTQIMEIFAKYFPYFNYRNTNSFHI